ncbi:MAG TPA: hypothetical protein VNV13_10220 [Steroidobacteraceae bacterium]|jgi:hypothetical protein|nr:hypothetical protein [Steroidobacteraceae bacterium]
MYRVLDHPLLLFALSFVILWLAARFGASFLRRWIKLDPDAHRDFATILAATLTLNGLIIGFTFSMATGRYEQRKNYEEAEANAIGTEFVRTDLMAATDATQVRMLLQAYIDQRLAFYRAGSAQELQQIQTRTSQLQMQLWSAVRGTAAAQPTAIGSLVISGMNDVLNSQGYTDFSWWNRIPRAAWFLMAAIAVISHMLIGYGAQNTRKESILMGVLPFIVSLAFLLIADIDSPRSGIIRVAPRDLTALSESIHAR